MIDFDYKYVENDTYMITKYIGDESEVIVPDRWYGKPVSMIYDDVFKEHAEIEKITIPDTVTCIGSFVFRGCTGLKHLELPIHLRDILQYAFADSSLEEVHIPDTVTQIVPFTFYQCRALERVIIGKGVKRISNLAFEGCDALKEIYIPQTYKQELKGYGNARILRYTDDWKEGEEK